MEPAAIVLTGLAFIVLLGIIVHAHKRRKKDLQIIRETEMRLRDLEREKKMRSQIEKISKMEAEQRTQKINPEKPYRKSSSQPLKRDSSSSSRRDDSGSYDNTSTIMTYAALSSGSGGSGSDSPSSDSSSSSSSCDY